MRPRFAPLRGILHPQIAATMIDLRHHLPSEALAPFIARYWIIRWDLSEPHVQDVIPFPCVNLAIERGRSGIFGVATKKQSQPLAGKGIVFGVKFLPGAFYPFLRAPVSTLTDTAIPIAQVFGDSDEIWQREVLADEDDRRMIARFEEKFLPWLPDRDPTVEELGRIISRIVDDRTIVRVDDVLAFSKLSKRSLQRMFRVYVGVTPKWVIKRYRVQDAAEQLATGKVSDWPRLAQELGYFDQSHFIRDFKTIIGQPPARYAASCRASESSDQDTAEELPVPDSHRSQPPSSGPR